MIGKRYSKQRELIYQAVCSSRQHPTAEMVYQWLKPDNPNLSLGTVYRNLNLLADEGFLTRMPFPIERYDANLEPHTHFHCKRCGGIFDLEIVYDPEMDTAAAEKAPGFRVDRHELLFTGLCDRCREQEEKS